MRDLSEMRRKRENSSRTAIWVTRVAEMAWLFGLVAYYGIEAIGP